MIIENAKHLAERVLQHGKEYAEMLEPCIIERRANGDIVCDDMHPVWHEMLAKYRKPTQSTRTPLEKANTIRHVKYPILSPDHVRVSRYMTCLACEHAGHDDEGGPVTCRKCGCGSDPLRRRWIVLDAECSDKKNPQWVPGVHIPPPAESQAQPYLH